MKRRYLPVVILLCPFLVSADSNAQSQCVLAVPFCTDNVNTFNLQLSGLDSSIAYAGADPWASNCNGTYGFSFPSVQVGTGDIPVYVEYDSGPSTLSSNPNACGVTYVYTDNATFQIIGGQILLWGQKANGDPCPPPDELLTHELGHMFGLADVFDPSCAGTVMYKSGGETFPGGICQALDNLWYTPQESARDFACETGCRGACFQGLCDTDECFQYPDGSYSSSCYSPILIDIGGSGFHLTSAAQGVAFDLNSDGHAERLSWPRDGDNAFLCLDRNHNGRIDNGRELFGNYTIMSDGSTAHNGFAALAEYDKAFLGGNNDGWIGPEDSIWTSLLIWRDANHNGISEPSELLTLDETGILRIDIHYVPAKRVDQFGNAFRYRGECVVLKDKRPQKRQIYDVFFVPLE